MRVSEISPAFPLASGIHAALAACLLLFLTSPEVDAGTNSSAMMNAIHLEQQTEVLTVGEPTGGKPNSFGEIRTFSLPNSDLTVRYSTKYFRILPELASAPSFEPEVEVRLTSREFFAGADPVMDWIMDRRLNTAP